MSARQALRAATADDHARVDRMFSAFDLGTPGGYRSFLRAQAIAYIPAERALDDAGAGRLLADWPDRRRAHLLTADIRQLGGDILPPPDELFPDGVSDAGILGAIYVLEGSRLGGSVLKRAVPDTFPAAFLGACQGQGSWRKLLEKLDEFLYEPARVAAAVDAARHVFQRFASGAERVMESR